MRPPSQHGKITFDYDLLVKFSNHINLILLFDYKIIKNHVNEDTQIYAKCLIPGCQRTFKKRFKYIFENGSFYCKTCTFEIKSFKMKENMNSQQFIKPTRCNYRNCHKEPFYNNPGCQYALYCSRHKLEGMVPVCNPIICKTKDCDKYVSGESITKYNGYCDCCGQVNIKEKESCALDVLVNGFE